jgi:hypothetical protein
MLLDGKRALLPCSGEVTVRQRRSLSAGGMGTIRPLEYFRASSTCPKCSGQVKGSRALNSVRMTVEWDERKAAANLKKHRVAFEDAATVFRRSARNNISGSGPLAGGAQGDHRRLYNEEARGVRFPLRTRGTDSDH